MMTNTVEMLQWETVKMRVCDLVPHIKNPKKWRPKGQEQLAESLRRYGVAGGLRCTLDGRLLDGHGRCEELAKAGFGELEIDVSRCTRTLTPEEEADLLSRFAINNRTWDFDVLKEDDFFAGLDLEGIGFDAEALRELVPPKVLKAEDDDYVPPAVVVTDIVLGDLFEFRKGEVRHRLLCGDSMDSDAVERLMDGEKADLVCTDPPYGVDYVGKTAYALPVHNDSKVGLTDLLNAIFSNYNLNIKPGTPIYCFHPPGGNSKLVWDCLLAQDWRFSQQLIWVKDRFVLGHSDYHYQHEPIAYFYKKADSGRFGRGGVNWFGNNAQKTILEFKRPTASKEHPTMKPVELVALLIGNSSDFYSIIIDLTLGSGTTMVAAHQLERNCYGMELDPKYCQVIVDRMRKLDPALEITRNGVLLAVV